jgi:hypothetical protein
MPRAAIAADRRQSVLSRSRLSREAVSQAPASGIGRELIGNELGFGNPGVVHRTLWGTVTLLTILSAIPPTCKCFAIT